MMIVSRLGTSQPLIAEKLQGDICVAGDRREERLAG